MVFYVENPFGFGKYEIRGENAQKAKKEFEIMLEKLNSDLSDVGNFAIEHQLFDECLNIIKIIENKYNVEIYLFDEKCTS